MGCIVLSCREPLCQPVGEGTNRRGNAIRRGSEWICLSQAALFWRPLRLCFDSLLSGLAGISLGSGRTRRARGSCGPRRTCRSRRSRWSAKPAILYHYFSLVLARANFDYAGGRELGSNPTKASCRTTLDLHGFVWADFNVHARLARSPNSSYDR